MNTSNTIKPYSWLLCFIPPKRYLLLPFLFLCYFGTPLLAQQNCGSPTDPITGCNIMYCDGSMCDDLVPADGVSTCTSCAPCGVTSPPSDRYACARVELDLTGTPEYAADPTLAGCDLTLDTQENGNFDFYIEDGSVNCGTPDFQIGDGAMIPINVVTNGMVELLVCKTGGSGRRDLNILLSCCSPAATCRDLPDINEEGCDIPAPFTDYNDVFSDIESCGTTITMDFEDNGDTGVCSGFDTGGPTGPFDNDGADFVRTYTLFFNGIPFATCTQNIVIEDTTPPNITCPADATVECGMSTAPAATGSGTAMDACGPATVTFNDNSSPGCGNTETITRTWTATDACGNPSSCTQIITVVDTTPPTVNCTDFTATFEGCPGSLGPNTPTGNWITVGADLGFTAVSGGSFSVAVDLDGCVSDLCNDLADLEYSLIDSYEEDRTSCSVTLVNEFSIRDECGNISDNPITTKITIQNTSQASIVCPADATVECGMSTDPADTGMATASDDCGSAAVTFSDSFVAACGSGTGVITRTWTTTMGCGSPVTCSQLITIVDTTPPSITCPADATVECGMSTVPADTGMATGNDACGTIAITFSDSSAPGNCPSEETITRTWTATDQCGNPSSCTQIITVVDTTPPTVTCADFTATFEGCPGSLGPNTPTGDWITVGADLGFTAASGGSFSVIVDLDGCVSDLCSDLADLEYTLIDSYEENRTSCSVTLVNEFSIRDECGNISDDIITTKITIQNTSQASIICPANVTVECGMSTDPADTGMATASDACGSTTTTFSDQFAAGCGNTGVITRTWATNSDCGSTATCTQIITIIDTTPPVIICPANTTVECGGSTAPNATGTATGSDTCGSVSFSFSDSSVPGCGNTEVITRTWVATDACGNPSSCTQTITVVDTTPPSITCPANVTVECGMSTAPTDTGMATGADGCGTVAITSSNSSVPGCGNTETITRTWTATDQCGNPSTCTQIITVVDTTPPSITCPANVTVECGMSTAPADTGMATGADGCGTVTITFGDSFTPACGNTGVITRTWTATDQCGNPNTCTQIITIIDTTAPVITGPLPDGATMDVECNLRDPNWTPFQVTTDDLTITDNCSERVDITVEYIDTLEEEGECGVSDFLSLWRCVWTATDECGNSTTYTLFLRIIDTQGPVFTSFPDDIGIECSDPVPPSTATAEDNCSEVDISFVDTRLNGNCENNYTIRRRFTATDGCGNPTTQDQFITVTDTTPPVLTFEDEYVNQYTDGQDVFTDCSEFGNIINLSYAVDAQDNCSGGTSVDFDYEDFGLFNCAEFGYSGYVRATWSSTDECGNTASVSLNFFLVDQTAPTLQGVPEDDCVTTLPPPPNVQAVDECEFASLEYTQSDPVDCEGGQFVERTWTATDVCGNTTSATQRITISDGTNSGPTININYPGLSGLPSGSTAQIPAQCNPDGLWFVPDFDDAVETSMGCTDVAVRSDLLLLDSGTCSTTGYMARYLLRVSAADLCGNFSEYELFIEFIDVTPPVIESAAELVLSCGEAIPEIMANDACNEIVSITFTDPQPIVASCANNPQNFERIWSVTDACNNTAVFTQSITIIDDEGPVFSNVPADACNDLTILEPVTAFDECSGMNVAVDMTENTANVTGCGQVLTRTWTATDACGNTATATQQVFFTDDNAPVLEFAHPLLVGLEDGEELILPVDFDFGNPHEIYDFGDEAIAIDDNCASNLVAELSVVDITEEGDCISNGYLARLHLTWTVTDPCGNSAKINIILIYVDTYAPEIFFVPEDVVLNCADQLPSVAEVFLKDNYDQDIDMTFEEIEVETDFGQRIIRRWTATDDCGNTTVEEQFIDIIANTLACEFVAPEELTCNTSGNEITVIASGGTPPYTYSWEMTDCDGFLTSDPTEATVTFTVGFTTQNFSVTITDAVGCERVCTITLTCEKPDDIGGNDDNGGNPEFSAYPNPTNGLLTVKATELAEQKVTIGIYSTTGQVMFRKQVGYWPQEGYRIPTADLPNGLYLLKVESEGRSPMIEEVIILH